MKEAEKKRMRKIQEFLKILNEEREDNGPRSSSKQKTFWLKAISSSFRIKIIRIDTDE